MIKEKDETYGIIHEVGNFSEIQEISEEEKEKIESQIND